MNITNKNIVLVLILILTTNIFAQLKLSTYTDKSDYQYGGKIQLFCKVTNTVDTTFQFFAGTYESCQAEFSFNDFNSWEHTACLATSELLTFEPHSSKIYSWTIDPVKYGLPNNEGNQMIIGTYYFGLKDTAYITAPQYLGGQVSVGFLLTNSDSVQSIKDSLNVTVLNHSDYGTVIDELWQVEGFQIDSVINYFQNDSILTYIERAVFVEYDNIIDEDPLNFYPLHVGDYWTYEVKYFEYSYDEPDTTYYATTSVSGINTLEGRTYFVIDNVFNERKYIRIDSTTATVWEYREGVADFLLVELSCSKGDIWGEYFECIKDTTLNIFELARRAKYIRNNIVFTSGEIIRDYIYAYGIGEISLEREEVNVVASVRKANLVYANIDGREYGTDPTDVKLVSDKNLDFNLEQNYPNPFNPSTTIKYSIHAVGNKHAYSLRVRLKVYDIIGREIATLVNKEQLPGNYKVQFNADELTSGIYFYRLQYGDFTQTKKMLLLK